jgi:hypothetical protein
MKFHSFTLSLISTFLISSNHAFMTLPRHDHLAQLQQVQVPVQVKVQVPYTTTRTSTTTSTTTELNAKKKKKKKPSSSSSSSGLKGFGSSTKSSNTNKIKIEIDKSQKAMDFYTYLENNNAGSNLKRVALGYFPIKMDDNEDSEPLLLRGVVALQKIKKGEIIIEIPYEAAMNLGRESSDPTLPATVVLQEYCNYSSGNTDTSKKDYGPYLEMLPPFNSFDPLGSTDFFSDEALDMLQSPQIKEETLGRREKTKLRFERDIEPMMEISNNLYQWGKDGDKVTAEHLQWAVWLVTSRVLTVAGEAGTDEKFRLMIPLIDMCNHDRDSVHVLTGRAVPGGTLKVIAGKAVDIGEQVNIVYGGGVSGNDRFIQDYGFLDSFCLGKADDITAKILLGKARIVEGAGARNGRPTLMPEDERERALKAFEETTLAEDESLLMANGKGMANDVRSALEFRIGVKKALKKLGHGLILA